MGYRVYSKGRNIYVLNEANSLLAEGLISEVLIKRVSSASTEFTFSGINDLNPRKKIDITNIKDENGVVYNINDFISFYENLTNNQSVTVINEIGNPVIAEINDGGGSITIDGDITAQLAAVKDNDELVNLSATNEGHLEVALHDPLLPFGSVHVESLTPIFQTDAVYGINSGQVTTVATLSGTATANDSSFEDSTVTAPTSLSTTKISTGFKYNSATSKFRTMAKA